jgi:hypothetical protein
MRIFAFGIAIAAAMFAPVNAQGIKWGSQVLVAESANSYAALARTKRLLVSKAKIAAAVTVKGVETLTTTMRTNAREAG